MTKQIVITVPDNYDAKKKGLNVNTMMSCDKCEFLTPDMALFVKHTYDHVMSEEQPETLTTAP
jgi:hypothetical protein